MSFESGHSYYGYDQENYDELIGMYSNLQQYFFEYQYHDQTYWWIDANYINDLEDLGMISADWMAVYGRSIQFIDQL